MKAFDRLGLWEQVDYLTEGDSPDAELLHALTGDEYAQETHDALLSFTAALPGGYSRALEQFDYVIPVLSHIEKPAVVGIKRLVYRPRTSLTAAWYALHREASLGNAQRYLALAAGDFDHSARSTSLISRLIKDAQGGSMAV